MRKIKAESNGKEDNKEQSKEENLNNSSIAPDEYCGDGFNDENVENLSTAPPQIEDDKSEKTKKATVKTHANRGKHNGSVKDKNEETQKSSREVLKIKTRDKINETKSNNESKIENDNGDNLNATTKNFVEILISSLKKFLPFTRRSKAGYAESSIPLDIAYFVADEMEPKLAHVAICVKDQVTATDTSEQQ